MGDRRRASSPGPDIYKIKGLLDRRDFCIENADTANSYFYLGLHACRFKCRLASTGEGHYITASIKTIAPVIEASNALWCGKLAFFVKAAAARLATRDMLFDDTPAT